MVATENGKRPWGFSKYFMHFLKTFLRRLPVPLLAAYVVYALWGRRFLDAWRYHRAVRAQREHLEVKIKRYRLQTAKKHYFIRKLMTDADFRERVLHEQIGYIGEDEYAIYFREEGENLTHREEKTKNF